ncbi:MAG TPA: TrkA family potassium uptake protein [Chloroflexota bacterium]|nr:TrkA family potassium uptake protein [Chloroflexota bacterium]
MKVVIVGCGRIGAAVAGVLSPRHDVAVVDWNPGSFGRLRPNFEGETVIGNGIDSDTLHEAGVAHADIVLALTDGDNRNLMTAQVARQMGAKDVLARVYDPERAQIFADLGVTTFSPTVIGAQRLFDLTLGDREGA